MKMRKLGTHGPEVSALSLGCMGMSDFYGPADEAESTATIHAALEAGMTMLDTGDFYGMGHNEMLVGEAIRGRRDRVFLAVKFGAQRDPGGGWLGVDARPQAVKTALAYSLRRLKTDHVDLYMPARVDPKVPIEETVGAIADCVKAGWVRHIGLSETSADTVRRAHAVHPIAAVQIEYAVATRGVEQTLLPTLRELGIALTAYGVLSRGLLGDTPVPAGNPRDFRAHLPRFSGANLQKNLAVVEAFGKVAEDKKLTRAQLAIAWALARGEDIVPLVGARRRARLTEALGALEVTLSSEDLARIDAVMPPGAIAGDRYAPAQMTSVEA